MSSGDFEIELRQSVADNLALIANAAKAAKARIGQSVAGVTPLPQEPADFTGPRPAVNFDVEEPAFRDELASPGGPAFAEEPHPAQGAPEGGVPEGAITFDNYSGMDDDGIPVWEDPP